MPPTAPSRARLLPLAALAALALAPAPSAQELRKEEHPQLGLVVMRPRRYAAIPLQPNEPWIVLRYVEEPDRRRPKAMLPELWVVRIDWTPDPEAPAGDPQPDERTSSRSRSGDREPLPINSLARYVEQRLKTFDLGPEVEVKERPEQGAYVGREHALQAKTGERRRGWAYTWQSPERTYALIGFAMEDDVADQVKTWRKAAEKLEIGEPAEFADAKKWRRFYERNPELRNPEFRIGLRSKLVRGWEAEDTENFILLYGTKNEALIRDLKRRLEAIRKAYVVLFPAVREVDAVSAVRICADMDEYRRYGGPPSSGGYWNHVTQELVFFEYEDEKNDRGSGKEDARIVLYHEAFHQYIYYSVGEVAPHSWFNEGYGDYFSGAVIDAYGEVQKIGVNPWRVHTIQKAIKDGRDVSFEDIIRFEKAQYYDPRIRSICYAQGWSMIYFLNESSQVARTPEWARILPTYFETLKAAHQEETAALEAEGAAGDPGRREEAARRSRERAVTAAFEGVDLQALEDAWRAFVLDLKAPK